MSTKDAASLYDTILKSPDLNAEVKLHGKINGRLALYLVMSLEYCASNEDAKNPLGKVLSEDDKTGLDALKSEILQSGKLQTFYDILKRFA